MTEDKNGRVAMRWPIITIEVKRQCGKKREDGSDKARYRRFHSMSQGVESKKRYTDKDKDSTDREIRGGGVTKLFFVS